MDYFVRTAWTLSLCLNLHFVHAQSRYTDSLVKILPHASAKEKPEIIYQIGSQLFFSSPDSAMGYFNESLKLLRHAKNDTIAAKCLYRIGILNFNSGDYEKAIENFFSSLKIFE